MLIDIFRGSGTFGQKITMLLLIVLTTLISLTVHEVSHAGERAQPGPNNKGDEAATAAVETALTLASLTQPAST